MSYEVANALFQWEEGRRRLDELADDPGRHRAAIRVIDAVQEELRRRIGPTFTVAELAEEYSRAGDWSEQIAFEVAPAVHEAWDPRIAADAAFHQHMRGATDYAGGRFVAREQT